MSKILTNSYFILFYDGDNFNAPLQDEFTSTSLSPLQMCFMCQCRCATPLTCQCPCATQLSRQCPCATHLKEQSFSLCNTFYVSMPLCNTTFASMPLCNALEGAIVLQLMIDYYLEFKFADVEVT